LLERARDGFARLDAGEIDAFELDELIHRCKRPARELWKFCGSSGSGSERAASMLAFLREQRDEQTGGRPARPAAGKAGAALTVPPGWTTRQHCQDPTVGVSAPTRWHFVAAPSSPGRRRRCWLWRLTHDPVESVSLLGSARCEAYA
jgi:hypothetical protein